MPKQIFTFLLKSFLLSIPILIIVAFFSIHQYLPAITENISLDAKIFEQHKLKSQSFEIISIGSSMTLNNLNSKTIYQNLNKRYYNLGAWGLQISDIRKLASFYIHELKPKYVILGSSIPDFKYSDQFKVPAAADLIIYKYFNEYFYLKNFDVKKTESNNHDYMILKKNTCDYANLNFDEYGGVALTIPRICISKKRWNEKFNFPTDYTSFQYKELSLLAKHLQKESIKLIFIQCPIKPSYATSENERSILNQHYNKCKSIIESNAGIYLNLNNEINYQDSMFVDQFHLSDTASKLFTKKICDQIKASIK